MKRRRSITEVLLASISPEPTSGCWLWLGRIESHGYGRLCADNRVLWAHRASYETAVGPIPADKEIDHICCVRSCVNPRHLRVVTHAENMARQINPGRQPTAACPRGHPMSGRNAMLSSNGSRRRCRACHYAYTYAKRRRGAAVERNSAKASK